MVTFEEINRYANNRENFEKLVDLCIGEYVVPYIGAGLSDFANRKTGFSDKFYIWWNYLSIHYHDCFKEKLVNNTDLYKTADLIENAKGKEKFHESIRTTYGYYLSEEEWKIILDKAKDEAISVIPELFNGPIITTNFDQILEKVHNPMLPVYLPYDEDALRKLKSVVKGRHPSIYKVHGSVSNVDKIIFTGKSYNKAYKPDSELVKTLSDFYKGFCFLFLGCSLKMSEQEMDKSIKLWTQLTNTGMSHFAILEESNDLEKRQEELDKQNIKPIFFPKGKFETIKIILSEILRRKKSAFGKIPEYKSDFIKRKKITEKIERHLGKSSYSAFALTGMAGVGKTRIMREYAFEKQNTHMYKKIIWFNAISKANILSETYQFALNEKLIKESTNKNQENVFKKVKNWMIKNDNWLFLLDNVENHQDIKELLFFDSNVTKKGKRHFLITTRKSNLPFNNEVVDIFDKEESQFFLHSYTKLKSNDFSRKITVKLGYLPLALEQAAAYIKKNKIDYQQYFKKLKESLEILKQGGSESRTFSVEATWNVSMRMIENEESKQLLNLCAFFAPDNIHCRWFSDASEQLSFHSSLQEKVKNENEYKKILYELAEYSLVRIENEKINIHRLLQEIIRKNSKKELITICMQIMDKHCFFDFSTIEQRGYFTEIIPHIITLTGYSFAETKESVNLYLFLGFGYNALSNYSEALKWYKKALFINKRSLSDTSTIYNNIAIVYNNQGNYPEALKWYKKALVIDEKVFGKNHSITAITYNNIAVVYNNKGKYSEALKWNRKALTINEKNGKKNLI
jgi:tetratricopeptide (TPR) repeat protein